MQLKLYDELICKEQFIIFITCEKLIENGFTLKYKNKNIKSDKDILKILILHYKLYYNNYDNHNPKEIFISASNNEQNGWFSLRPNCHVSCLHLIHSYSDSLQKEVFSIIGYTLQWVLKTNVSKKMKNIIENTNKPSGKPHVFYYEKSMDSDYFAFCEKTDDYSRAKKYQLQNIKEYINSYLQPELNNNRKITIRLIKEKLNEYKNCYVEDCNLKNNSIEMKWLNYWSLIFLINFKNEYIQLNQ